MHFLFYPFPHGRKDKHSMLYTTCVIAHYSSPRVTFSCFKAGSFSVRQPLCTLILPHNRTFVNYLQQKTHKNFCIRKGDLTPTNLTLSKNTPPRPFTQTARPEHNNGTRTAKRAVKRLYNCDCLFIYIIIVCVYMAFNGV